MRRLHTRTRHQSTANSSQALFGKVGVPGASREQSFLACANNEDVKQGWRPSSIVPVGQDAVLKSSSAGNSVAELSRMRRKVSNSWIKTRFDYWAENVETLGDIVTHVLIHEIGHHFGLSDDDMERIEEAAEQAAAG
jgi:hypothetical protein